jgi:uncharacterized protein (DUF2126 family)
MKEPYTPSEWQKIDDLGQKIDDRLQSLGVGLMMGGEPTFVSATDLTSPEWQIAALGEDKRQIAGQLLQRLADRFAGAGGLLHYGQGKWYPGEPLPRWALGWNTHFYPADRVAPQLCRLNPCDRGSSSGSAHPSAA